MEKLSRRSDGAYETPSGLFAIAPRAVSGRRDGTAWFEFKATPLSEVIRVEWPDKAPVVVLPQETARVMLRNQYAFGITDEQMDQYNAAVDAYNKAHPEQEPEPEKEPEPAPTPVAPDTGAAPPAPAEAPPAPPPAPTEPPAAPAPAAKGKGK